MKKKKKIKRDPKFFVIPVAVYSRNVYVSIQQTDKECLASLAEWVGKDPKMEMKIAKKLVKWSSDDYGAMAWTVPFKGRTLIRFHISLDEIYQDNMNIVAHEIFHTVHAIMDWIKMKLTFNSCEAWAYLTGYLNEMFAKKLVEYKKKGKK